MDLEQSAVTTGKPVSDQPMMALLVERDGKKKRKKKKKKKKKGSLVVRVLGRLLLGGAAAFGQMGDAVSGAADKYDRKHRKSRKRRKKDGWTKDLGRNVASAASELLTRSAKTPSKFAKAVWKKDKKKKKKDKVRTVLVQPIPSAELPVQVPAE